MPIDVITTRTLTATAAERFITAMRGLPDQAGVCRELAALADPTSTQVEAIIGNDAWTRPHCTICHDAVDMAAELGSERVCGACLAEALGALRFRQVRG